MHTTLRVSDLRALSARRDDEHEFWLQVAALGWSQLLRAPRRRPQRWIGG